MNQKPIHVFAKWQVREGQIEHVLALLKTVTKHSTEEAGNLFYTVQQSASDINLLILFEGYKDEAALAAHRSSTHFQTIVMDQLVPLLQEREVILTSPIGFD